MCPPDISFIATSAKQRPLDCGKCWSGLLPLLCNYSIKTHFWAQCTFTEYIYLYQYDFLSPYTQAAEPIVNSRHCQALYFHRTRLPGGHTAMTDSTSHRYLQWKGQLTRLHVSGDFPQIDELSLLSLKGQTPDALALSRPMRVRIIGHLMVHQSITVCRDVRQKPVHSVEQKGFRIFGWSLPAPCIVPQREKTRRRAKTMPVSRVERGWHSSSQSPWCVFIFLMSVKFCVAPPLCSSHHAQPQ